MTQDDIPTDPTTTQTERAISPRDKGGRRTVGPESEVRGGPEAPTDLEDSIIPHADSAPA